MSDGGAESFRYRTTRVVTVLGRLAFIAGVTVVTVLCLMPADTLPPVPIWDKLAHFVAYGMLATAGGIGYPERRARFAIVLFLLALGIGIEFAQSLVPGRDGSPMDVVANSTGVLIGISAATLLSAVLRRARIAKA